MLLIKIIINLFFLVVFFIAFVSFFFDYVLKKLLEVQQLFSLPVFTVIIISVYIVCFGLLFFLWWGFLRMILRISSENKAFFKDMFVQKTIPIFSCLYLMVWLFLWIAWTLLLCGSFFVVAVGHLNSIGLTMLWRIIGASGVVLLFIYTFKFFLEKLFAFPILIEYPNVALNIIFKNSKTLIINQKWRLFWSLFFVLPLIIFLECSEIIMSYLFIHELIAQIAIVLIHTVIMPFLPLYISFLYFQLKKNATEQNF